MFVVHVSDEEVDSELGENVNSDNRDELPSLFGTETPTSTGPLCSA